MDQYDYLVINDDLDVCVSEMHKIIQGEHQRSFRNESFIQSMKQDLKGNVKGDRLEYVTSILYRFDEGRKSGR